jgi:hypothetical protein
MELVRSHKPLVFTAVRDTVSRPYVITPITDNNFRFGNMLFFIWPPANPLGYLVDLTNPQRYYYGKGLSVDAKDTSTIFIHTKGVARKKAALLRPREERVPYFSKDLAQKGTYFTMSVPIVDHMQLQPYGEGMKESWGGFGFSLGLEHYYEKNKAMGMRLGLMTHTMYPSFAMDRFEDYYNDRESEKAFSVYLTAFKKRHINREAFSYGISNVTNWWNHKQYWRDAVNSNLYHTRSRAWTANSFGFEFAAYHYFNRVIQAGIIYRPTILTIAPDVKLMYQHTISFDMAFRFKSGD